MAIAGLCILLISYLVFHCYKAYCLVYENCHPKRADFSKLEEIPYKMEQFSFVSKTGITLAAALWLPNEEIKGTVIACHYLGGSKNAIYPYIEPLLNAGYRVTAFDYPNHGDSMDRRSIRYDLEEDMKRFLSKIKELGIREPYVVLGFSMGASLALSTAHLCDEVKAVVVDSGPLIFVKEYVSYVLRTKKIGNPVEKKFFLFLYLYVVGFRKMSWKMKRRMKGYFKLPVFIIHGKKDRIITVRNTEFLYHYLDPVKSKRLVVDSAHHLTNRILLGDSYDEMVVDFIKENLLENAYAKGKNTEDNVG